MKMALLLCTGISSSATISVVRIKLLILAFLFLFFGAGSIFANSVVLNEFMPHPSPGSDWIEIYNPTTNTIDLTSWILVDSTSTMKTLSGNITANGFATFDVTNRLNNSGDSIYLKDDSGTTIDNYSYSSDPGVNKSIGRSPDGGSWTMLASSSKGSSNGGPLETPTSTPTPTPITTPSPATPPNSNSFIISNIPSQINSDQSFNVSINLSLPNNPNTLFYLKGAFKKSDGSNYFGYTRVAGNWVKNGNKYSEQYPITTDSAGNWSGSLEVQPDSEDSGFTGSGDYIFKTGRYTNSGSGPTWSNESNINIQNVSNSQGGTDQRTSTNTSLSSTAKPSATSSTPFPKTSFANSTSIPKFNYQVASIAGATSSATPSAKIEVKDKKQFNYSLLIGATLVFAGVSFLGYIYLRRKSL